MGALSICVESFDTRITGKKYINYFAKLDLEILLSKLIKLESGVLTLEYNGY